MSATSTILRHLAMVHNINGTLEVGASLLKLQNMYNLNLKLLFQVKHHILLRALILLNAQEALLNT